eukprot:GEZU01009227.1.p1 GENE.GEZU01009227.1~~GEZU01009227.1.p1  ORF type:complete len:139 (+),score=26.85 GEZU01009227.1:81-497(+)
MFQPSGVEYDKEDAAELQLGPDFSGKIRCLMNSEVAMRLEEIKAKQEMEGDEESGTSDVFDKTYAYVQRFGKYKSHEIVDSIRDLLERNNLQEFEIAALCNLSPETTEEAKALLPSLNRFPDADLQGILEDLETYRNA